MAFIIIILFHSPNRKKGDLRWGKISVPLPPPRFAHLLSTEHIIPDRSLRQVRTSWVQVRTVRRDGVG